jgi:hypothetical protein
VVGRYCARGRREQRRVRSRERKHTVLFSAELHRGRALRYRHRLDRDRCQMRFRPFEVNGHKALSVVFHQRTEVLPSLDEDQQSAHVRSPRATSHRTGQDRRAACSRCPQEWRGTPQQTTKYYHHALRRLNNDLPSAESLKTLSNRVVSRFACLSVLRVLRGSAVRATAPLANGGHAMWLQYCRCSALRSSPRRAGLGT